MAIGVSDLRQRVEAALEKDERTADYVIEVIDQDGLITLKGKVGSDEHAQAAEEIAKAQEGVIDVTNALVLADEEELVSILGAEVPSDDEDSDTDLIVPTSRHLRQPSS